MSSDLLSESSRSREGKRRERGGIRHLRHQLLKSQQLAAVCDEEADKSEDSSLKHLIVPLELPPISPIQVDRLVIV
ncbi:MAG: hypothetical protein SGPRY_014901, partial [Prymnesium sp.]